jgi:hypothetical protein
MTGCAVSSDSSTITLVTGETVTAYSLSRYDTYVMYYPSKEAAEKFEGKVMLPLTRVKEITNLKPAQ